MNKIDTSNEQIRELVYEIAEAEMAGLRGEAMLALKRRLLAAKKAHRALFNR